jgi:hypothetical protein
VSGPPGVSAPAQPGVRAVGCLAHWQIQACCGTDHLAEHGREVLVQQQPRRCGERGGVCQNSSHVRPELAHRAVNEQPSLSLGYVRSYLSAVVIAKVLRGHGREARTGMAARCRSRPGR